MHARPRRPRRRDRGARAARRGAARRASVDGRHGGRARRGRRDVPQRRRSRSARSTRPGHCRDHVAYVVGGTHCLTADVLFRGTVGGTAGPQGDLDELKHSILDVLLALDDSTVVLPGHREATTIGEERATNPFVRAWLAGEGLGEEPCRVSGEDATLLLWAPDYDGGNKALVRFADGRETIVGGSRVSR